MDSTGQQKKGKLRRLFKKVFKGFKGDKTADDSGHSDADTRPLRDSPTSDAGGGAGSSSGVGTSDPTDYHGGKGYQAASPANSDTPQDDAGPSPAGPSSTDPPSHSSTNVLDSSGTTGMGGLAMRGPRNHNPGIPTPAEIMKMSRDDRRSDLMHARREGLIDSKHLMMATLHEGNEGHDDHGQDHPDALPFQAAGDQGDADMSGRGGSGMASTE